MPLCCPCPASSPRPTETSARPSGGTWKKVTILTPRMWGSSQGCWAPQCLSLYPLKSPLPTETWAPACPCQGQLGQPAMLHTPSASTGRLSLAISLDSACGPARLPPPAQAKVAELQPAASSLGRCTALLRKGNACL